MSSSTYFVKQKIIVLSFKNSLKIVNLYVPEKLLFQFIINEAFLNTLWEKLKFNKFAINKNANKKMFFIF